MIINVVIKGRYKYREDVKKFFAYHKRHMQIVMESLSKKFKVKLPKRIILRPMSTQNGYYPYWGRAQHGYGKTKDWEVLLTFETCSKRDDRGRSVLEHECAHIIDYLMYSDMSHGERFKKVQAACKSS